MKKFSLLNLIRIQLFIGKLTLVAFAVLSLAHQVTAQSSDTAPELVDFNFSSSTIDTTNESQNVVLNLHVIDNDNGVNAMAIQFRSSSGNQFVNALTNSEQRISGDSKDGIYSAVVTFPQYCKAGTWSVMDIEISDTAGNYKKIDTAEIASQGFPVELQVISNNEDIIAPEIIDFSFTPSAVETTNGSQTVTVTAHVTDVKAGVREIGVGFCRSTDDYIYGVTMSRILGDNKDGIYQGVVTFSRSDDSGTYDVSAFTSDMLGNSKPFNTDELSRRGFATALQVFSNAQTPSPSQKTRKRVRSF